MARTGAAGKPNRRVARSTRRLAILSTGLIDLSANRRAAKREEDLVFRERRERQRSGELSEWMIPGDDHDQVFAEDVDATELRCVDRPRHDRQVELTLPHRWFNDGVGALHDVQGNVGIVLLQRLEQ